jgi:hypothetical protein
MAPRGLKTFVSNVKVGKFCGGKFPGYRAVSADGKPEGNALRGITKLLTSKIYSKGELTFGGEFRGGAWQGANGGVRRGRAIDSQVSKLAGASQSKRDSSKSFKLTNLAFAALEAAGLEPLMGQRVVVDRQRRISTAADVVCYSKSTGKLVVVELKSGYVGDRTLAATKGRTLCRLHRPFEKAKDCILHRHFAQLAATLALLKQETPFLKQLTKKFGVTGVSGLLLYVCGEDSQLFDLPSWWEKRGQKLLDVLSS